LNVFGSFTSTLPGKNNFDCKYNNPKKVEIWGPRSRIVPSGKHIFKTQFLYLALHSPTSYKVGITIEFAKPPVIRSGSTSEDETSSEDLDDDMFGEGYLEMK
jgi:hypothetical protein